jgi:hypothetical protein
MTENAKDLLRMPAWAPMFFLAEGALGLLYLDVELGRFGSGLAGLVFLSGALWYGWYRNQLVNTRQERTQRGTAPSA